MLGSRDGISLSIEEKSCGREVSKTDRGCWGHSDGISLSVEEKSCGREVSKTDRGCWGHKMASACR